MKGHLNHLRQQIKEKKNDHDLVKEKQEEVKKQQSEAKEFKRQEQVKYNGKSLQSIGLIPKGGNVTLKLDPDSEVLSVQYGKNTCVQIPYSHIFGFRIECITEETAEGKTDIVSLALSSSLSEQKSAAKPVDEINKAVWVGTLIYKDRTGLTHKLLFAGEAKKFEDGGTPYKDAKDEQFEYILNKIAAKSSKDFKKLYRDEI